eukprot:11199946-Lingulodinium_polyedra.AAC.1
MVLAAVLRSAGIHFATRASSSGVAPEEDHIARVAEARGMEEARITRAAEEVHAAQKAAIGDVAWKRQRL